MTDEILEQELRKLPAPELPASWQTEILSTARREARTSASRHQVWPLWVDHLGSLFRRNPITSGAMAALWMLIFVFKAGTPVDLSEKILLAHIDPNRPVHFPLIYDEVLLAQLGQDELETAPPRRMP